jgi:hypothetical protein
MLTRGFSHRVCLLKPTPTLLGAGVVAQVPEGAELVGRAAEGVGAEAGEALLDGGAGEDFHGCALLPAAHSRAGRSEFR